MKLDVWKIFFNIPLLSAVLAQISAQIFKIFLPLFKGKKPDFKKFFHYGDIPSAHTAFVVAVSVSLALTKGWDSPLFGFSFVMASILIYDILKLRKTVEMNQKAVLTISKQQKISEEKRPQFKSHSPMEVFSGAVWGIIWAVLVNWLFLNHPIG